MSEQTPPETQHDEHNAAPPAPTTRPPRRLSPRMRRQRERMKSAATVVVLMVALTAVLLAAAWPWPRHFVSGLPAGPEAARDAWKLSWGAHRLLEGRVLPAHNAPMFYPHAGALDFDDPLYVPSLVAALPYSATHNAAFTYNVTLLVFWLLSAFVMYFFLRELGIGRAGCAFGAAAFALLPSRMAQFGDLSAQLCFGLPLGLMLLTRWVRTQQRRWAFLLALVVSAQALSALGYALALTLAVPLVALVALVRRQPSPFYDRPFYDGVAIIVFVPLLLGAIFLGPAVKVRTTGALKAEYDARSAGGAQPLAYLSPDEGSIVDAFSLPVGAGEASLFPGVAVLLLAGVYGYFQRQMLRRVPARGRARQLAITVLGVVRAVLWAFALIVCLGRAVSPDSGLWQALGRLVGPVLVGILAVTLLLAFIAWRRQRAFGTALMHGLGLAAAVCFVTSLGSTVTAGSDAVAMCKGPLLQPRSVSAFLGTIAPLSRVGMAAIVFLIAAAAWILDEVTHHRRFRWFPVPVLMLVCAESVVLPNSFQRVELPAESAVIEHLDASRAPYTLFAIPAGEPETDARWLLSSVGRFDPMVNGSATVVPPSTTALVEAFRRGDVETGTAMLTALWPPPYLLVDREALAHGDGAFALDEKQLGEEWWLVAEDARYALYEPAATMSTPFVIRERVRSDIAGARTRLRFKARVTFADPSLEPHVVVSWNGRGDQSFVLTSELQPLEFDGRAEWTGRTDGDVVTIALVFKTQGSEYFVPADEALAGRNVHDVWQVVEIEFRETLRR
jgi:hypothetical protein